MKSRRSFLMMLTAGAVALVLIAAPVIADELLGVLTKVDVEAKTLTVVEKGTDKEVEVKVTDETETVNRKNETSKLNLDRLSKGVEKAKEKGRKGVNVQVTHENGVASKVVTVRKKAAPKAEN